MIMIKGKDANELFVNISQELMEQPRLISPRGLQTMELYNAWLELENPEKNIVTLSSRNLNYDYLQKEFDWYLSGNLKVNKIAQASKFWKKLADSNGTVNSNYGFLTMIEKHNGISQLEWCIERLQEDKDTRKAIMNYNQPKHKYEDNKDFVCTISQQFMNREDGLDSIVLMRSNDLIYGLSYDLPWFTYLQKKVSEETGLPLGKYYHYAASLHAYDKHFGMVENMANESLGFYRRKIMEEQNVKG